jgi:hypothetical protein
MHVYKINIVLFFILLSGTNIKTSERILEFAKQLQESGWTRLNDINSTDITIDNSLKEVVNNTKEVVSNQSFSLENTIDFLGEKITYVATHYPLHILVGCFISKKMYNYYKIFKEEVENEYKDRLRQKIEFFLVRKLHYEDEMKILDRAYEKFIINMKDKIRKFPIDEIPADIKEAMEKLQHAEEKYPTPKFLLTEEMQKKLKYYMTTEEEGVLECGEYFNLWLTMRKKVAPLALEIWKKPNNEKID